MFLPNPVFLKYYSLTFLSYLSHYYFVPLYLPVLQSPHCVHAPEPFFLFARSLHPLHPPPWLSSCSLSMILSLFSPFSLFLRFHIWVKSCDTGLYRYSPALTLCSRSFCRCMSRMIWVNKWQVWKGWWNSSMPSQARPFNTNCRIDETNFPGTSQRTSYPSTAHLCPRTPTSVQPDHRDHSVPEDPEAVQKK